MPTMLLIRIRSILEMGGRIVVKTHTRVHRSTLERVHTHALRRPLQMSHYLSLGVLACPSKTHCHTDWTNLGTFIPSVGGCEAVNQRYYKASGLPTTQGLLLLSINLSFGMIYTHTQARLQTTPHPLTHTHTGLFYYP